MAVNTTYIYNGTDIWDNWVRFNQETGYLFGDGIILVIVLIVLWRSNGEGISRASILACLWGLLAAIFLWLGGWSNFVRPLFMFSMLCLSYILKRLGET